MKIKNQFDEDLDLVVDGNEGSDETVIFVHGFGTNKDEGSGLFVDISRSLVNRFRIVRFDFAGYGKSEGRQEDMTIEKEATDLDTMIGFVRKNYGDNIYLLGMSLGCYVIALLSPDNIKNTVFVSPPDSNQEVTARRLEGKISLKKDGVVNKEGITIYPRSSGELQRIGQGFWKSLHSFNAKDAIFAYSRKTDLFTIIPVGDEILERKNMDIYDKCSKACIRLKGNHAFTNPEERKALISNIVKLFENFHKTH